MYQFGFGYGQLQRLQRGQQISARAWEAAMAQIARLSGMSATHPLVIDCSPFGMNLRVDTDPPVPAQIDMVSTAGPAGGYSWTERVEVGVGNWEDVSYEPRRGAALMVLTGTTSSGAATITGISSTTGLIPNQAVSGTGIPAGAHVLSVDSTTQVSISANATASGTVAVTFAALDAAYERNHAMVYIGTEIHLWRGYRNASSAGHEWVFDHPIATTQIGPPGLDGRDGADSFIPGPPGRDGRDGTPAPVIPGLDGADGERGWLIPPNQESGHRVISETIPAGTYHNYPIPGSCDQWNIIPSGGPVYFTGLLAEPREVQIRNGAAKPGRGEKPSKICFLHQNSGSSAANRFLTPDRQPLNHQPQEVLRLKYEATEERYTFGERPSQPTYPGLGQYGGGSPGPSMPPNPQTGTTYTPTRSDRGGLITRSNSSTMSDTIPIYDSGWYTDYQNLGPGTLTVTPASGTINGQPSMTFAAGQGATIASDGTNLTAQTGGVGAAVKESGEDSGTLTVNFPTKVTILDVSGEFVAGVSRIKVATAVSNANPLQITWRWYDEFGQTTETFGACFTSPFDQRFQGGSVPITVNGDAAHFNAPAVRLVVEIYKDSAAPSLNWEHTWALR